MVNSPAAQPSVLWARANQPLTAILDPDVAPARELAALYPERWEIETTVDELKTHLRGRGTVLRSKPAEPRIEMVSE